MTTPHHTAAMREDEELLPCVFCKDHDLHVFNDPDEYGRDSWGVQCGSTSCAICGPQRGTRDEAIKAWNTRADERSRSPSKEAVEGDALVKAAKEFCRRVECGEIRSKRSYTAFKAALALYQPADTKELVRELRNIIHRQHSIQDCYAKSTLRADSLYAIRQADICLREQP